MPALAKALIKGTQFVKKNPKKLAAGAVAGTAGIALNREDLSDEEVMELLSENGSDEAEVFFNEMNAAKSPAERKKVKQSALDFLRNSPAGIEETLNA